VRLGGSRKLATIASRTGTGCAQLRGVRPLALTRWLALGALFALAPACDISPQPAPPGAGPEIHGEAITLHVLGPSSVELRGNPGAVTATSPLLIWNAELADADASVESASDGSFSVVMNGQLADVFRLDVTTGTGSAEADLSGTSDGGPAISVVPAFDGCLTTSPLPFDFGSAAVGAPIVQKDLVIASACTANVDIVAFDLRDGTEFVPVAPGPAQLPLAIAPGAQATLRVGFKGLTPGLTDDFVRVRFTSPTGPRRLVRALGELTP